jgi:hypothetical protein
MWPKQQFRTRSMEMILLPGIAAVLVYCLARIFDGISQASGGTGVDHDDH